MDITIQFVVEIVVSLIFQRSATGSALKAFNMEVLILDADENTTELCCVVEVEQKKNKNKNMRIKSISNKIQHFSGIKRIG